MKIQKIIGAGKDVEQLEILYAASGRGNWYNHYRNAFDDIYKTEYTHKLCLKDSTLRYIPNGNAYLSIDISIDRYICQHNR